MAWGEKEAKGKAFETRRSSECDHGYQPIGVRARNRQRKAAKAHGNLKPMRFVSLHHHSTFSYLDGHGLPEAHVRRATEVNMSALAMTEHGNIFSHVKMEKAAEEQGVKPIFGCEVYMGWTDERRAQRKNHLTVLAKNAQGYRNLLTLVSRSWAEGFYYEPTVDPRWLYEHKEGLIILSGCLGSALATALIGGKHVAEEEASYARGRRVAKWFRKRFGEAYFLEVQAFPELEPTRRVNPMIAQLSKELKIPLVATMDCHYTAPEEVEIQKLLHNVRPGEKRTLEDMVRDWGYDVPLCAPSTDKSIYGRLRSTGIDKQQALDAIINTELIAQDCNVKLPKLPRVEFPLPEGYTDHLDLWRDWLKEGWEYRGCNELPSAERVRYRKQLAKEMEIIEAKGYANYFLIVSDFVKFAKGKQIPVGPARGSAAASIAAWLLRITEVNPMLFPNLVFERFIDWSRSDMPDIDLDFTYDGRAELRDYGVAKYGADCVSNIGTFTYYRSKNSLDDAARVHGVPKFEVEKIKDLLLERSSGDLRASATIEDTADQFTEAREVIEKYPQLRMAMDLEGNVKGFGVHAAGIVISNGPITKVCALLEKTIEGNPIQVVSMDKYDAERQGLEKLDFLSLSTMDMIDESLRLLEMPLESLYSIPLDDPDTIQGFKENDVTGVFQFDGRATRSVNGSLRPDSFKEICDINALSRPGPLHNGAAEAYIEIKKGTKAPELLHPVMDTITADTNYQIVYQEQILRIVREIGNFDWTHASYIRKIISKKLGEQEFNRQWEDYWAGASTVQDRYDVEPMSEQVARDIWGRCITAGAYAFNAAHATSYGMLAFWTMWIKRHHPDVFYAAALSRMPEGQELGKVKGHKLNKHSALKREAVQKGLRLHPPDAKASGASWVPGKPGNIQAGLVQISGIAEKSAKAMLDYRDEHGVEEWEDYLNVKGVGPGTLKKITDFCEDADPFGVGAMDSILGGIRDELEIGMRGSTGERLPMPTHTAPEVPYDKGRDIKVVFLGLPVARNLRDIFESNRARTGEELDPATVKNPELREFMLVRVTDGDEMVQVRFDRWTYPRFRDILWKVKMGTDVFLVEGVKMGFRSAREIYAKNMWVIEP